MTNCNEINVEAGRLKSIFGKCYNLKALDLRDVVDLIKSVNACANGDFDLKTVNGVSLFGTGNIVVTADVDGTETKIQQGQGILVTGAGSAVSPYVIKSNVTQADGSETKISQGANVVIAGAGTIGNPYVINANVPPAAEQVNADWTSISGKSMILNKPTIPAAQVNADWNAVSGPAQILNKPNTIATNLGYVASIYGGEITSSTGSSASIPLVTPTNAGLVDYPMLEALRANLDNVKLTIDIPMPAIESNDEFKTKINTMPFVEILAHQIPTFRAIKISADEATVFYVELIGRGRSGYGVGGFQIASNQIRVTSFPLMGTDVELMPTTQVINLGASALDVTGAINASNPDLIIQSQATGHILVRGTFLGKDKEYLWTGAAGTYGSTGLASVNSDLKELGVSGVAPTLQLAYEGSAQPQVVTNAAKGSLVIKRGSVSDSDNVFEIQNGAGAIKAKITGNGDLTATTYNTYIPENNTNKAVNFSTVNNTLYPTVQAVKNYADGLVVGLLDDRGSYNASVNSYPASGGSGIAGAVMKGDIWYISATGTLGGVAVSIGDSVRAIADAPGQLSSNWALLSSKLGYVPANAIRRINTTAPLQGGGDLSADRTLSIQQSNTTTSGFLSNTDWNTFNNKQPAGNYETAFSKNTAFNKNFGTTATTVAQGNDSRILNGQAAFAWGNHASAGYLTGYVETDTLQSVMNRGNESTIGLSITGVSPLTSKLAAYKSFLFHHPASNEFIIAPSVTAGAEDWDWSKQYTFGGNGVLAVYGGTSTQWNTAFSWGNHAGLYQPSISGTSNYLAKYGSGGVVQSQVFDDGTSVRISKTGNASLFIVNNGTTSANSSVYIGNDSSISPSFGFIGAYRGDDLQASPLVLQRFGGSLLVNTTTDNGVDKLQVDGSAHFSSSVTALGFNASSGNGLNVGGWQVGADSAANRFWIYSNALAMDVLKLNSTGAATFSSSVTGNNGFISNNASLASYSLHLNGSETARIDNFGNDFRMINFHPTSKMNFNSNGEINFTTVGSSAFRVSTANVERLTIASTGEARFSSSVTATALVIGSGIDQTLISGRNITFYNAGAGASRINVSDDVTTVSAIEFSKSGAVSNITMPNGSLSVSSSVTATNGIFRGKIVVNTIEPSSISVGGYTPDGLWGGTSTPLRVGSGLRLGYQDNGSGLYGQAYGFDVKHTDGAANNVEYGAIIMRDIEDGTYPFRITNKGKAAFSSNVTATSFVKSGATATNILLADGTDIPQSTFEAQGALVNYVKNNSTVPSNLLGLATFVRPIQLTTNWQDLGIGGADLATGTFAISIESNDFIVGGNYSMGYSGITYICAEGTNENSSHEVLLTGSGHASLGKAIFLRIKLNLNSTIGRITTEIRANYATTGLSNYIVKFRKLI